MINEYFCSKYVKLSNISNTIKYYKILSNTIKHYQTLSNTIKHYQIRDKDMRTLGLYKTVTVSIHLIIQFNVLIDIQLYSILITNYYYQNVFISKN